MVASKMNEGASYWVIGNVKPDLYGEKVGWQEIATTVESVYLPSTIDTSENGVEMNDVALIPNNKVYFFAVGDNPEAAKALTALLNSAPARAYAGSYAMRTGGNYIQNQAWVLGLIPLPAKVTTGDVDQLDTLSKECHSDGETDKRMDAINQEVGDLYGLTDDELESLEGFMDFFLAG